MGSSDGRGSGYGDNYGDRRRGTRSAVTGEREGDEGESERVREGDVGFAWHFRASPGRRRKQEVAGVWPRAPATRSSSSWQEEEDDWQGQSTGPSQVGWASTGKAQVASLSLFFLIVSVFLFNCNCCALKILKRFQKS